MKKTERIPHHVAIIMDGNGRWAKERGLERSAGHQKGVESVRASIRSAQRRGVGYLTLYVFSTENWGRPKEEVDMLMDLFCRSVINEIGSLKSEGVRVHIIGDREGMPAGVREHLDRIERETAAGEVLTMVLALNYSSRAEITRAVQRLAAQVAEGKIDAADITAQTISQSLYTADIPDPDLVIRTGGDKRLSNFLLWQASYSELYFTDTYWPDFGDRDFDTAIDEYARRERRYGLVREESDNTADAEGDGATDDKNN